MLRARIKTAVELEQDQAEAEMSLSILGRNTVIEEPLPAAPATPEEDAPEEPITSDPFLQLVAGKLDGIIGLLTKLNDAPVNKPGTPTSIVNRLTTDSTKYVDLVVWTIPPNREGSLQEISFDSDNPSLAQFRLIIVNEEQWTNLVLDVPLTIPFRENILTGDSEIKLQMKTDGTSITGIASIAGVEREA